MNPYFATGWRRPPGTGGAARHGPRAAPPAPGGAPSRVRQGGTTAGFLYIEATRVPGCAKRQAVGTVAADAVLPAQPEAKRVRQKSRAGGHSSRSVQARMP